jgi:V8-like Glu-specific endopeptidase
MLGSQPTGRHASVSNQHQETARGAGHNISQMPSEGQNPRTGKLSEDGTEAVKGYKRPKAAERAHQSHTVPENLPDIGEASFGKQPAARSVIGTDDRVQVNDTTTYPWRAHASLLITAADNSQWIGTGWFIGPHTLMTAGHVVHIKNSGVAGRDGWVKQIDVMSGRNGAQLPYGTVTTSNFRSVSGWTNDGDQNYDYGAIIIPTDLGNSVGWFGFGSYTDADLLAATGNISGYPGDKPSGTQWFHGRGISSVNNLKVFYDIDTAGGQSGSAVYRTIDGGRYAIAIHAYGVGGGSTSNSGTRITSDVHDNMLAWRA